MKTTESSTNAYALEIGSKLGQYTIVAQLSSGGMASLYLARQAGAAGFFRHVAIKVVHPHLAQNDQFLSMFIDEAKLSARIQHPNVVHVEELGEDRGMYYLVMEYVHGCSLARLLAELTHRKQRLSVDVAVWIAGRVAEGLHAAHELRDDEGRELGVVHRDVSPQNILLASNGHVKLIDFGIAKAFGRAYQTATGSLKGKLKYMAPEQARSSRVDRRTDIYALGIVLWEMLTMRRMFRADNEVELLEKVRHPDVASPVHYAPHLNQELCDAVMQALALDTRHRPDSALAVLHMFNRACPRATTVDASQLASLLTGTLGDELSHKLSQLPARPNHQADQELAAYRESTATAVPKSKRGRSKAACQNTVEPTLSESDVSPTPQKLGQEAALAATVIHQGPLDSHSGFHDEPSATRFRKLSQASEAFDVEETIANDTLPSYELATRSWVPPIPLSRPQLLTIFFLLLSFVPILISYHYYLSQSKEGGGHMQEPASTNAPAAAPCEAKDSCVAG